ncbi:MAG: DNA polymerase III subunit gamma/tau [Selenomonadaceae bacterium]|nr:DNA polymerase III subunit gamma/tau [Selenomonadaceae bacterium]
MAYVALYRKWRPGTFADLVGQDHIARTISEAIKTDRIGHAYLFSGPRGTGKTSTAKILAKGLNCEQGPTPSPCGVCESCKRIADGSSMDVLEIDAASNRGIDEIRELRETVKFAPTDSRYKVYIIDEVHMLTMEAFNALLKTLEEPPSHVVFILATTEAHKVPATIQSRCQRYDFKRITLGEIKERLAYVAKESGYDAEDEALGLIALQAEGGMRDALSLLDQCSNLAEGKVTVAQVQQVLGLVGHEAIYRLTEALAQKEASAVLKIIDELMREGKDLRRVLTELSLHLRSLMIYAVVGSVAEMDLYNESPDILQKQKGLFTGEEIMTLLKHLSSVTSDLKWSPAPRITVEVGLLAVCQGYVSPKVAAPQPAGQNVASSPPARPIARSVAPAMAAPPVSASVAPLANAGGEAVWEGLLKELNARRKRTVIACLKSGKLLRMDENRFILGFPSEILTSIAAKNAGIIESTLLAITGRNLKLLCQSMEPPEEPPPPPPPPKPKDEEPKVDWENMPKEEQAGMHKAMDILGGTLEAIEE